MEKKVKKGAGKSRPDSVPLVRFQASAIPRSIQEAQGRTARQTDNKAGVVQRLVSQSLGFKGIGVEKRVP